jgi:hypothetical protein
MLSNKIRGITMKNENNKLAEPTLPKRNLVEKIKHHMEVKQRKQKRLYENFVRRCGSPRIDSYNPEGDTPENL